eukprot:scaffold7854_cov100-Skeletonema_dohrnii-CCMP3373.AAC.5
MLAPNSCNHLKCILVPHQECIDYIDTRRPLKITFISLVFQAYRAALASCNWIGWSSKRPYARKEENAQKLSMPTTPSRQARSSSDMKRSPCPARSLAIIGGKKSTDNKNANNKIHYRQEQQ